MSYFLIKNIKVKKNENKISVEIADSSLTDWEGRYIYHKCEDICEYSVFCNISDKKALLIYNVILGNYHCSQYKELVCTFDYFKDFIDEMKSVMMSSSKEEGRYGNVLKKFEKEINSFLIKDCYLKNGYKYVTRINKKSISLNYKSNAKTFNSKYIKNQTALLDNGYEIEYL